MKNTILALALFVCLFLMMRTPVTDSTKQEIAVREVQHNRKALDELYRQADALLFSFNAIK